MLRQILLVPGLPIGVNTCVLQRCWRGVRHTRSSSAITCLVGVTAGSGGTNALLMSSPPNWSRRVPNPLHLPKQSLHHELAHALQRVYGHVLVWRRHRTTP